MKVVNPKYIYGSVKISGPAIDFTEFLCNQVREFDRDVEAFVTEYILGELLQPKKRGGSVTEEYFVIYNSDGDTTVDLMTKEQLLSRIDNDSYYGGKSFIEDLGKVNNLDTNYWPEQSMLIIKGKIVTPRPKEVVTKREIE